MIAVHDHTACLLGEGPLWHPERGELWWFDILNRTLHGPGTRRQLPDMSSAMGWVDRDAVLMARRGALVRHDLATGAEERVAGLDEGNPLVRSNDGRADPFGGFWIGTMGLRAEADAGAIWRLHRGELRRLLAPVTIPNAICFAPDGSHAHYSDTARGIVWRHRLDGQGWPVGEGEVFLDLSGDGLHPDGAVTDADGHLWVALWGSGEVRGFAPDGRRVGSFHLPARQSSCPAIGLDGTLYVTSAAAGLPQEEHAMNPGQGRTHAIAAGLAFKPECRVVL